MYNKPPSRPILILNVHLPISILFTPCIGVSNNSKQYPQKATTSTPSVDSDSQQLPKRHLRADRVVA